jgi:polar amino acid transport system substrate-binding protein
LKTPARLWIVYQLSIVGFLFTNLAGRGADDDPPKGSALTWAADSEGGAPYVFLNNDPTSRHKHIGFEVDIADALGRELGRPMRFKQYEFNSLVPGLERGDFDFIMNGLEVTPDRQRRVRFSRPYYVYRLQLVAREGDDRFQSIKDLEGRADIVVGTLEDTAASRLLDRLNIKKRVFQGQVEPFQDLANGRIDAVLLDLPIALYFAQKDPKLKYAQANPKLKFVGPPIEKGYYAIAFNRQNEALAAEVDAALGRLIQNGKLELIYEKWGLWNDDQKDLGTLGPPTTSPASADEPSSSRLYSFAFYFPRLLSGAAMTVYLTILSMALAVLLGLPIALCRLYGPGMLRGLAMLYVEFFRGIPVYFLVFFLYFGLPALGAVLQLPWPLDFGPMVVAVLAFGLNYAAYESEVYRTGIASIPTGQWEAAASLGMSNTLAFRRVILPQAIRHILPPMTNDFIGLFKDTSVVSVIAVEELTKRYLMLSKPGGQYIEIGLVTALLYLSMSVPLGYLSRYLEQRWGRGHA